MKKEVYEKEKQATRKMERLGQGVEEGLMEVENLKPAEREPIGRERVMHHTIDRYTQYRDLTRYKKFS